MEVLNTALVLSSSLGYLQHYFLNCTSWKRQEQGSALHTQNDVVMVPSMVQTECVSQEHSDCLSVCQGSRGPPSPCWHQGPAPLHSLSPPFQEHSKLES